MSSPAPMQLGNFQPYRMAVNQLVGFFELNLVV